MATSKKVSKSTSGIYSTHPNLRVLLPVLVVVAGAVIVMLAMSHGAFASHKFH